MLFRKRVEVKDVSYDPKSAMLKAYTTAKEGEIGILYLGMRLRNYYLRDTLIGPTPAYPGAIYYFEREDEFEIENGWLNVHVKPFYGGFLSKSYEGVCYIRCVRVGKGRIIFPNQVHIAPICCLNMKVKPEKEYITSNGVKLELEGGKELKGSLYCDKEVKVKICRVNDHMRLNFSEVLLEADLGSHVFSWRPFAVEKGVVMFGDITGKKIVKTFGMSGKPYILSDITYASNSIILEVEWGKLGKKRISVPIKVFA